MKTIEINTINNAKVIPARLKEARVARSLSLAELSEKIGVSSQAISQYELGITSPISSVMIRIVEELDFPITFFYKEYPYTLNASDSATFFRSNKNLTKKMKEAFKVRINWVDEIYAFINRYLELPKVDMPNFDDLLDDDIDNNTIELIVERLRKYWGLGDSPIPNMIDLLQIKGFVISRLDFGTKKIDAFSRWNNGKPYIILGSDKSSSVRSRFDLAHELGHLILHKDINQDELSNREIIDRIEDEANYFAAAFLLSMKSFCMEVVSSSIDQFTILKKRWKVSISAMIKRSQQLGILTDNQVRYLNSQMVQKGYFRKEPLDDEIKFEMPYLFKQAFNLLIENNILNKQKLLDILSLNSKEAESLYCLGEGFFAQSINPIKLKVVT